MEEGILMDRLPILLQRDMQYYEVVSFFHVRLRNGDELIRL